MEAGGGIQRSARLAERIPVQSGRTARFRLGKGRLRIAASHLRSAISPPYVQASRRETSGHPPRLAARASRGRGESRIRSRKNAWQAAILSFSAIGCSRCRPGGFREKTIVTAGDGLKYIARFYRNSRSVLLRGMTVVQIILSDRSHSGGLNNVDF